MSDIPLQAGVDDVHAHHKTRHRWVDLILALSAITISVVSLYVAICHGRTEEKLVAASSWPFPTVKWTKNGLENNDWIITFRLQNSGIGPARIQWMRMALDGKPLRDQSELMKRCCGVPNSSEADLVRLGMVSRNGAVGVLPARESTALLAWRARPDMPDISPRLVAALQRLKLEACYCSVLSECWISDLTATTDPQPVAACRPIADGYLADRPIAPGRTVASNIW